MKMRAIVKDDLNTDGKIIHFIAEVSAVELDEVGGIMGHIIDDRSPFGVCMAMIQMVAKLESDTAKTLALSAAASSLAEARASNIRSVVDRLINER